MLSYNAIALSIDVNQISHLIHSSLSSFDILHKHKYVFLKLLGLNMNKCTYHLNFLKAAQEINKKFYEFSIFHSAVVYFKLIKNYI